VAQVPQYRWLTPVILATWEAKIGRMELQHILGQPGLHSETLSQNILLLLNIYIYMYVCIYEHREKNGTG
jgi:hypothetical protein